MLMSRISLAYQLSDSESKYVPRSALFFQLFILSSCYCLNIIISDLLGLKLYARGILIISM